MKRHFGLIGYPLAHSKSAEYFENKFRHEGTRDADYSSLPLKNIESLRSFVRANDLLGFNVTIPHKTTIIPYLDELSEIAHNIGAVNTVKVIHKNGKLFLKGYNTDSPAFLETIKPYGEIRNIKALVLGSGGASLAVCHALGLMNIPHIVVSRNPSREGQIKYESVTAGLIKKFLFIINTTPLGMYPDVNSAPALPYEYLSRDHFLYDLVYNPSETLFLQKAKQYGAKAKNGMEMLRMQADYAWKIWSDA